MCNEKEFAELIKSFYTEQVTNVFLVREWYENLKKYSSEIIAKALTHHGNYRMNNLKEIEDYCSGLQRDKKWHDELEKGKEDPLSEEDKEWARNFYKKYCEEEYQEKIKKLGLEE